MLNASEISKEGNDTEVEEVIAEVVVKADVSMLKKHPVVDMYLVENKLYAITGSLSGSEYVDCMNYVVEDINGFIVDSGKIQVGETWSIDKPGLVMGWNLMKITAQYGLEQESIYEIGLINFDIENTENAEINLSDSDGDGIDDYMEGMLGTDINLRDTDEDGIIDKDEVFVSGTDPLEEDTDKNGVIDSKEDSDGDGLSNQEEIIVGTNCLIVDTDGDGLDDGVEVKIYMTNPLEGDTDGDTLTDSQELELNLNPNIQDSDADGISDEKEKIRQTYEKKINKDSNLGVSYVSVNMICEGHIDNNIYILDTYNIDMRSSEVVGLVGAPVDISCVKEFDVAEITFGYDESLLGSVKEENLGIMWYDEENDNYIVVEDVVHDIEKNTLSCSTNHFSTWMLVDKDEWKKCWNRPIVTLDNANEGGYSSLTLEMEDGIHRYQLFEHYGTWKDAEEICDIAGGHLATIQNSSENMAVYNYIKEQGCVSAYIGLSDAENEGEWRWSNGEETTYVNWHWGEPNGYGRENYAMYYYLYEDGSWNDGSFNSGNTLLDVSIFICEWEGIDINTDTDKDGLPDYYEKNGFMMSNGTIVYTDPNLIDSDGDKIDDYNEVGGLPVWEEYNIDGRKYKGYVNHPSTYGKLSQEFMYVDGTMNIDGSINTEKMNYVPEQIHNKEDWYEGNNDIPYTIDGETKYYRGKAGLHGLFSHKLEDIGIDDYLEYFSWNSLVISVLGNMHMGDALNCFLVYTSGLGGTELGIDNMATRYYININGMLDNVLYNSANENFKINMIKAIKAAEMVLDENNSEIYISVSPNTSWRGCLYHETASIKDIEQTISSLANMNAFGTFNKADAGVTIHCVYDSESQEYTMDYNYYLIDFYDFDFASIFQDQDALSLAQSYELYGKTAGSVKWHKGDKVVFYIPDIIDLSER